MNLSFIRGLNNYHISSKYSLTSHKPYPTTETGVVTLETNGVAGTIFYCLSNEKFRLYEFNTDNIEELSEIFQKCINKLNSFNKNVYAKEGDEK